MGSSQQPDNSVSTALAITKDDMAALAPAQRAAIAQRKNANIVAAQIAGTNWGKGMDAATQRAVADWGQRNNVDVTTEIYVLGGNIYLNAQFYMNRGIDLINKGEVLDYHQRFIHHDPRLEDLLKEVLPLTVSDAERAELVEAQARARREIRERRDLRIAHGVPDGANIKAAVLTTIEIARLPGRPFYGCKWTPHPNAQHNDPVGANYPQETALTRSARRAWKQVARQVQSIQWAVEGAEEDAQASLAEVLRAHAEREALKPAPETHQLTEGVAVAEYVATRPGETVPVMNREQIDRASTALEDDPFYDPKTAHIPTPFDDVPPAPTSETLFGTVETIEPTAEEKAEAERRRIAAEDAANLEEDRRIAAADAARETKKRAS